MTTWVFLRGLTREARHWGDFPQRFREILNDGLSAGDILTPDLPGNGRLYAEVSPTRISEMVDACRRQLSQQGKPPPYHVLALSLGGMAAVDWAARYPEECAAVVLLSTSLRPYSPFFDRLRPRGWPLLLRILKSRAEARERAILDLTSARASELRHVLPDWADYARECPVSRLGALRQLIAAARFCVHKQPSVPLLLLAGDADRMVHPRCSRRLAEAWGAEFALHPTAGHDLPLDDADWVALRVKRWLASGPPAGPA